MLTASTDISFLQGLKLDTATLLLESTPREWLLNKGKYQIVVRWQQGHLGIGAGESEHEAYARINIVATDKNRMLKDDPIEFNEIKTFMNWSLDDQVCLDL
jgi:hypothetical protein